LHIEAASMPRSGAASERAPVGLVQSQYFMDSHAVILFAQK
jgi:hypothetical protein